eukprot:2466066-Alexandrium_andersonii.AAC.1
MWLSSIPTLEDAELPEAFEASIARALERPFHAPPKLARCAFCAAFRADAESADDTGWRARR